ncbi:histidine kinase dimerization/phosphoacceptor domain -containing protein [Chitinophaga sancti]|uniref:sensor histidine kinase n=1 Tax=Chitinophaga sancti TaxID=1004 RepID=UPI003F79166A
MRRYFLYTFFLLTTLVPAYAQVKDSTRIIALHQLGKSYLAQNFSPIKQLLVDTAIEIFDHAIRLSDTLQLEDLKNKSMVLKGIAYCAGGKEVEGEKILQEAADIYHRKGDLDMEADTWLKLAKNVNRQQELFFAKAISLYEQTHNMEKEAAARLHHADYLYRANRYSQSEKELLRTLDLLHQAGSRQLANVYYFLSLNNRYLGSYEKALSYATKCVDNAVDNHDTLRMEVYSGELALVYDEMDRAEESCQWYRKTLATRIAHQGDPVVIFRTAGLLIRQLVKLQKSRAALALMDSLIAKIPAKSRYEKGIAAQNYAYCFDGLKRYPEAEQNFLAAIAWFKGIDAGAELISIVNMDAGRFYLQHGQFARAHRYLDTALEYRFDDRLVDQKELYHMLFTADSAIGNYAAAIKNLEQFQFLNDSIYTERKSKQIEELTIQYETGKKEQSIRLLEKEKRIQQAVLTKEQNTKRWIIGVSLLLIVIIGLLVNRARLKQRAQLLIEKKNISLQHLVEEKEWLVREIHHRVKNNFHIVMGLLHTQAAYLQGKEAIEAITESRQRIQAMSLVHQKLYQSDNLSAINMADYIHELIDYLKDSFHTSTRIQYKLDIEAVQLDVSHCVPLGLILNEAVTNAIKHAFPTVITIVLKRTYHEHIVLSIKDNGIGLPPGFEHREQASMGMKLMRGLGDDLEACLMINSDEGTEILIDFICEKP